MKRLLAAILFLAVFAGSGYAVSMPTEEDYQNLDQLRAKLVRMRKEIDKFMKDIVGPYSDMDKTGAGIFGQDVRVDVTENDNNIIVRADLPGMSKDKIDITLANDRVLTIAGSREVITQKNSPGVVRQERMSGQFERVLQLPNDCESQGIKAMYNEGVLEIVLPKKKNVKEEKIKVNIQ